MKSDRIFEKEQFMIACRSYFPDCKFENGTNIFMSEVEYATEMHAWASVYFNTPGEGPNDKPVDLDEPIYVLDYEIDKRSYVTRQNREITHSFDTFIRSLKKLKKAG